MVERERRAARAKPKLVAAWGGAGLTLGAVLGLVVAPGAQMVWLPILVFGIATIPQVLLWRHPARNDDRHRESGD